MPTDRGAENADLIAEIRAYKKGDGPPGYGVALLNRAADALGASLREKLATIVKDWKDNAAELRSHIKVDGIVDPKWHDIDEERARALEKCAYQIELALEFTAADALEAAHPAAPPPEQPKTDLIIAAVRGTALECLGYADESFLGNVPMGVKHVANRILGVLENGPPKPEDCFTDQCRCWKTHHAKECPLSAPSESVAATPAPVHPVEQSEVERVAKSILEGDRDYWVATEGRSREEYVEWDDLDDREPYLYQARSVIAALRAEQGNASA